MKQLAIYGKGGIGKSTVSANLAAFFAESKLRTWYIGCDPKADGSMTLLEGRKVPTFLEQMRAGAEDVAFTGFNGVNCVETGGPVAGVGCAGRGIIVAMQALSKSHFGKGADVIIYDVPGDVVCGGFAAPLREKYADEVYIVTSGEYLSLYAANNIVKGLANLNVVLGGVICNSRDVENERAVVEEFSRRISSHMIAFVPRSGVVRDAENHGHTVIQHFPDDAQAEAYRQLGRAILSDRPMSVPRPLDPEKIRTLLREMC